MHIPYTDSIMAIAVENIFSFWLCLLQVCACNKLNALNVMIICMSYDPNASMCNLKLI